MLLEIGIISQLARAHIDGLLPDGISNPHFAVLSHLVRLGGAHAPLTLARAFQVPKPTMTNTLAGLEKRGLIEMAPNPEDGRSKLVSLTAAGAAVHAQAIADLGPDLKRLDDAIGADQIAAILPHLADIRRHLDAARDE
ncbi:MAG: MarR family transcriptional regulator [Pseudomonadota bacterium]